MTGWNMPPGCNVSDIPGNRPEDAAAEALMDRIFEAIRRSKFKLGEAAEAEIADEIFKLAGEVYHEGYTAGAADAAMAAEYNAERWRCGMCEYRFNKPTNNRCPSCGSDEIERDNR